MSQVRALLSHPEIHGHAVIAQLVERLLCNQDAAGSIPAGGTRFSAMDRATVDNPARPGATRCMGIPARAGKCDGDQYVGGAAILPHGWRQAVGLR